MTALDQNLARLLKQRLLVGIPGGSTHQDSKVDTAVIGYLNEFGDAEMNIPARPFLVPGVESVKDAIAAQMARAGAIILSGGSKDAADRPIMAAGLLAVDAVKAKITDGPFTQLSTRTLAARRQRGRTGEKPLIDTGELRNAVTYIIDKG